MCLGDWKLGNFLVMDQVIFTGISSLTNVLQREPNRVGFLICLEDPTQQICTVYWNRNQGRLSAIAYLALATPSVFITLATHGRLASERIELDPTAGTSPPDIHITTWYLPNSALEVAAAEANKLMGIT